MTYPSENVLQQLFNLVCGKELGHGIARTVYEHEFDPKVVVKVEDGACSFQNVIEWETWQRVKHTELAQWFAPCVAISPNGSVLVQRRTRKPTTYPDKVPAFFTDLKLDNFGMLGGENGESWFVAHDYGMHLMLEKGMTKRMVKADWWTL